MVFNALRDREIGLGSGRLNAFIEKKAEKNFKSGAHPHCETLEFADRICNLIEGYLFTLGKNLTCWRLHDDRPLWSYHSSDNYPLFPVFKFDRSFFCLKQDLRTFVVISIDGQFIAESENRMYINVLKTHNAVFIASQTRECYKFDLQTQIFEKSAEIQTNLYHQPSITRFLSNIGISPADSYHPSLFQIFSKSTFSVQEFKKLDEFTSAQKDSFHTISYNDITYYIGDGISLKNLEGNLIEIYRNPDNGSRIDEVYIQNKYLFIIEIGVPNIQCRILDLETHEIVRTIKLDRDRNPLFDGQSLYFIRGKQLEVQSFAYDDHSTKV